jgi:iron complex outermembrane receptor protein
MPRLSIPLALAALAFVLPAPGRAQPPPPSPARTAAAAETLSRVVTVPQVEVSTTRPGDRAPIARSTLDREALQRLNQGQDTPMALAALPGVYAYSDAGNGIGYSYLSIRGFPQRRISVMVNGVPLNDPQSHEVYWIDHPDLLASASEVQVQRGVGSALYGAASLGGSVNLETSPFTAARRLSATFGAGSYDTRRLMLEANSGDLAGGWNLYGRYSRISTDGYRDGAWSRLWSYSLAARRRTGDHTLRVNLYGGPEQTHLSYLGVPEPYLRGEVSGDADRDRRFNPIAFEDENDEFFEPHYELIHSWNPHAGLAFTQTLYFFDGRGHYDEFRAGRALADYRLAPWATADSTLAPRDYYALDSTGAMVRDAQGRFTVERSDLVRRRSVVNQNFGWVPRVRLDHGGGRITIGGDLRAANGRHVGEVLCGGTLPPGTPPHTAYYDYRPWTVSGGLFAREEWDLARGLLLTADLGWRYQGYFMRDDQFDGIRFDQPYHFALPRLGLTWTPRPGLSAFASWSNARREPAFRDLYDAEGVGSVPQYASYDPATGEWSDPLIRPETVNSFEAGAGWRVAGTQLGLNLYRMDFRDELVYAGRFDTDLGYPVIGNAARSVHQGVELTAARPFELGRGTTLTLDANASFSDDHFIEYVERYGPTEADEVRYDGNPIGFFPGALANLSARLGARSWSLAADLQYAGRLYLDNTGREEASIDPRTLLNLAGSLRGSWGGATPEFSLRVVNALDTSYESGGYMDYDAGGALVPHYIVAAKRNVMAEVKVSF